MKKSSLITSLLALSLICGSFLLQGSATSGKDTETTQPKIPALLLPGPGELGAHDIKLKANSSVGQLPSEADVYKFVEKKITVQDVQKIAQKLKMNGTVKENPQLNALTVSDGHQYLEIEDGTGATLYVNREHSDMKEVNGQPKVVPSDGEAIRYATEFLKELKWLPNAFKVVDVTESREIPGNLNPATDKGYVLNKTVHFYQHINNKPLLGVSRVVVEVGHNGEIEAVRKYYKEHVKLSKYKLKKIDQALSEVEDGKGISNIAEGGDEAVVNNIDVSYWEDAGTIKEQAYLHPVYILTGTYKKNGRDESFQAVIPAVASENIIQPTPVQEASQRHSEKDGK